MGSLKWEVFFFLLVTSVFHTRSQNPWDTCIEDAEVTNKVNCNFQTNSCAWGNLPGNDINWTRINSVLGNDYMTLSMEYVSVNNVGRIGSPWICNDQGNKYKLTFRYYLYNPNACQLSVYIQGRINYTLLMDVGTISQWSFVEVTSRTFYSTDCVFQIIFEAQKIGEEDCGYYYNEVRIDDIQLSKQQGTVSCTLPTTSIPASSLQSESHKTSPIMTTPRSNARESTTSFTRSYSYSEGLNQSTGNESTAALKRNENYNIQLTPGAIVGIVISLLVITAGIIVVIAYRRNVKDVCGRYGVFKRTKTNSKSNSNLSVPRHVANNSVYSVEDEESTVATNRIKPHSHGGNEGQNHVYDISQEPSSPHCYGTMQNADAKRETPQISGQNLKSVTNSDTDYYNIFHMTPSNDPQRVAMDAYDHVHTEADLSHGKTDQEGNVYSLARITADNTVTNASGISNRTPSPSAIDEYNRLNISGDNGAKHNRAFYDHLDLDTDTNLSRIESLHSSSPNHHNLSSKNEGNYNHLHIDLSRDQHSHPTKHYDHIETTTDHSPTEPLEG